MGALVGTVVVSVTEVEAVVVVDVSVTDVAAVVVVVVGGFVVVVPGSVVVVVGGFVVVVVGGFVVVVVGGFVVVVVGGLVVVVVGGFVVVVVGGFVVVVVDVEVAVGGVVGGVVGDVVGPVVVVTGVVGMPVPPPAGPPPPAVPGGSPPYVGGTTTSRAPPRGVAELTWPLAEVRRNGGATYAGVDEPVPAPAVRMPVPGAGVGCARRGTVRPQGSNRFSDSDGPPSSPVPPPRLGTGRLLIREPWPVGSVCCAATTNAPTTNAHAAPSSPARPMTMTRGDNDSLRAASVPPSVPAAGAPTPQRSGRPDGCGRGVAGFSAVMALVRSTCRG